MILHIFIMGLMTHSWSACAILHNTSTKKGVGTAEHGQCSGA